MNPFILNPFVVTWCTFRTVKSDKSTCQRCSKKWPCSGWVEENDWDGRRERKVVLVPSPLRPILTPINLSRNYIIIIIIIIIIMTNNWWENQTVCFWNYDTLATVFVIVAMKANNLTLRTYHLRWLGIAIDHWRGRMLRNHVTIWEWAVFTACWSCHCWVTLLRCSVVRLCHPRVHPWGLLLRRMLLYLKWSDKLLRDIY